MKYSYPSLFEIHPTAKTFLDLGCGQGFIPLYAAARGLRVDAVDIETETPGPLQSIPTVSYISADLKNWKPVKKYDIIVAHHSIQFLPKEYALQEFLPALCKALNPGGVLEVFSFTPEETLNVPTKYTLEEIVQAIGDLEIVKQKAFSYEGMHRKLGPHTFFELHIIAKKKI
ncbi:MAG: methyltransferase domain-containing protein [Candidatus Moranbacteria bacterium]|nr:methyltransferase domain-containing protein [Candidatus Moranbacteria bacterium]